MTVRYLDDVLRGSFDVSGVSSCVAGCSDSNSGVVVGVDVGVEMVVAVGGASAGSVMMDDDGGCVVGSGDATPEDGDYGEH